jgi:hypothetical protein
MHHADEASALVRRNLPVVSGGYFRGQGFLLALAIFDHPLHFRLHEDQVAVGSDVGPVGEGAMAGNEPRVRTGQFIVPSRASSAPFNVLPLT